MIFWREFLERPWRKCGGISWIRWSTNSTLPAGFNAAAAAKAAFLESELVPFSDMSAMRVSEYGR